MLEKTIPRTPVQKACVDSAVKLSGREGIRPTFTTENAKSAEEILSLSATSANSVVNSRFLFIAENGFGFRSSLRLRNL